MSRSKAKADDDDSKTPTRSKDDSKTATRSKKGLRAVAALRVRLAQIVWIVFVICALLLAVGALLIALNANEKNSLVEFVLNGADRVDLGLFSRRNGIKQFSGDGAQVKNALLNWGLGAVAYLVVGRILDRIIRP